jgi:hypothetical protein
MVNFEVPILASFSIGLMLGVSFAGIGLAVRYGIQLFKTMGGR